MTAAPPPAASVRVWDLPTRLFHWVLATAVTVSVITAYVGGNAMVWHFRCGYLVLTLLVFRLLWGFVGGHWSRFTSFVRGPATVLRYLRQEHRPEDRFDVGHNPLGSLSVLAMLAILLVQVSTGLVADDEIANIGPLNRFVSSALASDATSWHKTWGQYTVIGLVALHLAAIVFYRLRHRLDLIGPMLRGDKPLPADTPPSRDGAAQRGLALGLVLACGALVAWIVSLGS